MRRLITTTMLAALAAGAAIAVAASPSVGAGNARSHAATASPANSLTADVVAGRLATAKYATNLARAKADGYGIITRMIPNMGYHFLNPHVSGFNVRKPAILVYEHHGQTWQLGALEWVFTSKPAKPPLPGARYGTFGAACHYVDGTFVFKNSQSKCPAKSPQTPSSTSGTPTWSRCTFGSGIQTQRASTAG
jgi:hypothetical protein